MAVPLDTQQDIREMDARGIPRARISRQLGVSRNTVAKYADMRDMSPRAPMPETRPHPAIDARAAWMGSVLEADLGAPRKQRHTARRILGRLVDEGGTRAPTHRCAATWRGGERRARERPRATAALSSHGHRGLLRSTSATSAARLRGPRVT